MPIFKITFSDQERRANVYNHGCNFKCPGCSYKLKNDGKHDGKPDRFISVEEVKQALRTLDLDQVNFLGGEPTTCEGIVELADFAHYELGASTRIGHSNGSNMPPSNIDEMTISIKCISEDTHKIYTGVSNRKVLRNFKKIFEMGIKVDASSVYTPGLIDDKEIELVAEFIADIDPAIPYHIIGFVPVPDCPWRGARPEEVDGARIIASGLLKHVTSSCLTVEDFLNLNKQDPRYRSVRVI